MKALYFHYIYIYDENRGGPLVQINEFVRAFRENRGEIQVFTQNIAARRTLPSLRGRTRSLLKHYLSRYVNTWHSLGKNISYYRREAKIITKERPDVILARYKLYHFSILLAARHKHIPLVLWVDAPGIHEKSAYEKIRLLFPFFTRWLEARTFRNADRIIVVSLELKTWLEDHYRISPDKIEVVPNGVDIDKFSPEVGRESLRRALGIEDKIVLGFVGSFAPWHGIENIKEIASKLRERNLCFLLVGDGPLRQELESFASASGKQNLFIFTGRLAYAEIPNYVRAMDICLLPYPEMSFFYFSPLKLFEYMAAARPVVAAGLGQIKEIVVDGENGFLYAPDNKKEMNDKILRLIEDSTLRKKMGEKARETVREKYTWHKCAQNIADILDKTRRQYFAPY